MYESDSIYIHVHVYESLLVVGYVCESDGEQQNVYESGGQVYLCLHEHFNMNKTIMYAYVYVHQIQSSIKGNIGQINVMLMPT